EALQEGLLQLLPLSAAAPRGGGGQGLGQWGPATTRGWLGPVRGTLKQLLPVRNNSNSNNNNNPNPNNNNSNNNSNNSNPNNNNNNNNSNNNINSGQSVDRSSGTLKDESSGDSAVNNAPGLEATRRAGILRCLEAVPRLQGAAARALLEDQKSCWPSELPAHLPL
ncbi:unnamed protein product, partial [Polarella glacialis]